MNNYPLPQLVEDSCLLCCIIIRKGRRSLNRLLTDKLLLIQGGYNIYPVTTHLAFTSLLSCLC
jgi:hypothetical protein